jgi:histidinol-phosphate aminotransferase
MVKNRIQIENINPYIPGRPIDDVKREFNLSEVVKLASNENPEGASKLAIEAAAKAFNDISFYPDGAALALRRALAEKLAVAENELVFGCGTDEVISMIAYSFINEGDEMITADITFGQYKAAASVMGGVTIEIPVKDFGYDLEKILDAINDKTKVIFIANPNNPTGTAFDDEAKIKFLGKVPKNLLVVFDEAYEEYVENENYKSSVPLIRKHDNLMVLKTFSKLYGLASLRVGYGVMNSSYAALLERIRKPFNVSAPAQAAALASLKDEDFAKNAKNNNIRTKHYCYGEFEKLGLDYVRSDANFILADMKKDCTEVFSALMKRGYIVRPVGLKTHLRISIGTKEQMEGFFRALKEVL